MTRLIAWSGAILLALSLYVPELCAQPTNGGPAFKEIFDLARKELPFGAETQLDSLAAQGLMAQLKSHGLLMLDADEDESTPCLAGSRVFDGSYGYVRLGRVGPGVAADFRKAFTELGGQEKLKGLVLDLRFADGHDYAAAAELADLFLSKAQTLFNLGEGTFRSHEKANAITLHCAVLINHETTTAAEALAAVLRETGISLLIGDATAGRARMWRSFTLSDGTHVWLAGDAVKLGSDAEIPATGVVPDIRVPVKPEAERRYLKNPYYESEDGGNARTNRQRLINEAELIREHNGEEPITNETAEPTPVPVRDPVLARALDLLKGLAVVRPARP